MMREMLDYTERMTKAALSKLPDGEYDFEDWIDDDGVDFGKPIRLFVTVRKSGDRIAFDWAGSAPQVKGAINATLSVTQATSFTAIRSILPPDIPNNDGTFRAVEVTAPRGSIANMELPGACAARGLTGFRMLDCAFGALAKMAPEKVCAASTAVTWGSRWAATARRPQPFIYVDFTCGTWGGRPFSDGLEGNSNLLANMAAQSVEVSEIENPVEILANELVTDACGAGRFRGGAPFYRDYRMSEEEAIVQVRSDRQTPPSLRSLRGQARRAGRGRAQSAGGSEAVDVEGHHDLPARRRGALGAARRRGLGRSPGARAGARAP